MKKIPIGKNYSSQLLDDLRLVQDTEADLVINTFIEKHGIDELRNLVLWLTNPNLISEQSAFDIVNVFVSSLTLPSWASTDKIKNGCLFFDEYKNSIPILLGCLSLPYCYAAANGAEVLVLSERIYKDTQKRLEETAIFVFSVTNHLNWSNNSVFIRIAKVRLLHASIRVFCSKSPKWQAVWGSPINQEDMAGTNLAFSYIIVKGLRKLGKSLNPIQLDSYLHLWNVIGHLLGIVPRLIPENLRQAFLLDQAIAKRQFKPSDAGQKLTKALTDTLDSLIDSPVLSQMPAALMRFLLEDKIADLLDLPALEFKKNLIRILPSDFLFKTPPTALLN
jgi:hypothetical protein